MLLGEPDGHVGHGGQGSPGEGGREGRTCPAPLSLGGAQTLSPLPRAVPGTVGEAPCLSCLALTPPQPGFPYAPSLLPGDPGLGRTGAAHLCVGLAGCPFAQWTLAHPSSKTRRLALGSEGAARALHGLLPQPLWAQETPASPSIASEEAAPWTLASMCWAASGLCLAARHQHSLAPRSVPVTAQPGVCQPGPGHEWAGGAPAGVS